jgi:MFS superfamily sulfate permease-like transporter
VGCIGGVGVFLIITGFNVSTRLEDDNFSLSLNTLLFFLRGHNLILWVPAFALAVLLRVITSRWNHQLILPTCAHSHALFLANTYQFSFRPWTHRFPDNTCVILFRRFRRGIGPGLA